MDTQLELARQLGYLDEADWKDLNEQMERVDMTLAGLLCHQRSSHV